MNDANDNPSAGAAFRSFEDLEVYKAAREFRKAMYRIAGRLPEIEKFGLAGQIRRAAVSLTNNLAEGHGRYHFPDQIRFTLISRGSLEELIDDLNICSDEGYLPEPGIVQQKSAAWQVLKLMNGYLRYLRNCKIGSSLELRETPPDYAENGQEESLVWLDELLAQHPDPVPPKPACPI